MMSNFERAELLFHVIESASKHGPQFTALSGVAFAELKDMNDEAAKDQQAKADAAKKEALATAAVESKRIFPKDSGVQEDHDPPKVQRKV